MKNEEYGYYVMRHGSDTEEWFMELPDAIRKVQTETNCYKYVDDDSFAYNGVVFCLTGYDDPDMDGNIPSETWSIRKSDLKA